MAFTLNTAMLTQVSRPESSGPTFQGGELFPIRCIGCGEVIFQLALEDSLNRGVSLKDTLDQLGYQKICCRSDIQAVPEVQRLLKRQQRSANIGSQLQRLTLANTAPLAGFSFEPRSPVSLAPMTGGIRIVDYAPPVGIEPSSDIQDLGTTYIEGEQGPVNTLEYYLRQI